MPMGAIKDGNTYVNIDGKDYPVKFSLSALEEVDERFEGGYESMADVLSKPGRFKHIKWLFTLLLNEGLDESQEPFTEKQVGKMIHTGNINYIIEMIYKAHNFSNRGPTKPKKPPPDEAEEDEPDEDEEGGGGEGKNIQAGGGG